MDTKDRGFVHFSCHTRAIALSLAEETERASRDSEEENQFQKNLQAAIEASKAQSPPKEPETPSGCSSKGEDGAVTGSNIPSDTKSPPAELEKKQETATRTAFLAERELLERERLERQKRKRPTADNTEGDDLYSGSPSEAKKQREEGTDADADGDTDPDLDVDGSIREGREV